MREISSDELKYIEEFEKITLSTPLDCIIMPFAIVYIVNKEELGKTIGKRGINIQKLGRLFKRRVVIVADSNNVEEFTRNIFPNIEIVGTEYREAPGERAVFLTVSEKDRGIAIGRDGERIKVAKALLKRKFNADLFLRTRRTEL